MDAVTIAPRVWRHEPDCFALRATLPPRLDSPRGHDADLRAAVQRDKRYSAISAWCR